MAKDTFCSHCGARYTDGQPWPRVCAGCGATTYRNPLPVAVLLLPVDGGLLAIRRGIEPRVGGLALPGGFIELGESWQAAAARELREEAGIAVDPAEIRDHRALSAPDGTVLIFGVARERRGADLPPFLPTNETAERVILRGGEALAFPLHGEVVRGWFAGRGRKLARDEGIEPPTC